MFLCSIKPRLFLRPDLPRACRRAQIQSRMGAGGASASLTEASTAAGSWRVGRQGPHPQYFSRNRALKIFPESSRGNGSEISIRRGIFTPASRPCSAVISASTSTAPTGST